MVDLASVALVALGTTAGAATLTPVVLGVVSGAGVVLKTTAEIKNYPSLIEQAKFAFSSYAKTLAEMRCFLREAHDSEAFIQKMKVLDEIIIDLGLEYENVSEKYSKSFKKYDE